MSDRSVNGEFNNPEQRKQFGAFKNAAARVNVKPMVAWLLDHHRVVLYAATLTKTKGFLLSYFCWSARSNGSFGITLMGGSYLLETLWPLVTHFWGQNVPKWLPYGWRKGRKKRESASHLRAAAESFYNQEGWSTSIFRSLFSEHANVKTRMWVASTLLLRLFSYMLYLCTKINCNRIYIHNGWKIIQKVSFLQ